MAHNIFDNSDGSKVDSDQNKHRISFLGAFHILGSNGIAAFLLLRMPVEPEINRLSNICENKAHIYVFVRL